MTMSDTTNYRTVLGFTCNDGEEIGESHALDLDVVVSETDVTFRVWTSRTGDMFTEITAEGSAREVFLQLVATARQLRDAGLGF
jgi:hypothetical protein